jgi:hypothetical protein
MNTNLKHSFCRRLQKPLLAGKLYLFPARTIATRRASSVGMYV